MGDLYKGFGWCWGEIGCHINDRLGGTKKRGVSYTFPRPELRPPLFRLPRLADPSLGAEQSSAGTA
jgi:hypothetical protein